MQLGTTDGKEKIMAFDAERAARAREQLVRQMRDALGFAQATIDRVCSFIDRTNAAGGSPEAFEDATPVAPGAPLTKGQHLVILHAFRALLGEGMDAIDQATLMAKTLGVPLPAIFDASGFEARLNLTLDALDAVDALVAGTTTPLVPDSVPAEWLD